MVEIDTKVYKALGHIRRIKILNKIKEAGNDGKTIFTLKNSLKIPRQSLRFHLRELEKAGILSQKRKGLFVFMSVNKSVLKKAQKELSLLLQ